MGRKIFQENIKRLNIRSEYDGEPIEAEETFQQALAYLLGWIPTTKAWIPILSDVDGRLLVSTSPTKSNEANRSNPTINTVSALIIAENVDRKLIIVQNTGTVDFHIGFGTAAAGVSDFLVVAGATFIDDVYYGEMNGITALGTASLSVVEFT